MAICESTRSDAPDLAVTFGIETSSLHGRGEQRDVSQLHLMLIAEMGRRYYTFDKVTPATRPYGTLHQSASLATVPLMACMEVATMHGLRYSQERMAWMGLKIW